MESLGLRSFVISRVSDNFFSFKVAPESRNFLTLINKYNKCDTYSQDYALTFGQNIGQEARNLHSW